MGFHWSIDLYLDKIHDNLSNGCILIFGIRGSEAKEWIDQQIDSIDNTKYEVIRFVLERTATRKSILILKRK